MKSRVGGFSVEFARSGFDPAVLDICKDRLIVFGCVDPGDTPPEPLEKIVARAGAALDYIEPERLLLAPDCGLMTISRELALEKARLLVQTASELRSNL